MTLPTNSKERKNVPVASGCLDYFPDALAAVATVSRIGNEQHNPGQPLHWDRSKSTDHDDALMRHFLERGTADTDGQLHRAKVAWRALAALQEEIEAEIEPIAFVMTATQALKQKQDWYRRVFFETIGLWRRTGPADRRTVTLWDCLLYRRKNDLGRRPNEISWLTLPEG